MPFVLCLPACLLLCIFVGKGHLHVCGSIQFTFVCQKKAIFCSATSLIRQSDRQTYNQKNRQTDRHTD